MTHAVRGPLPPTIRAKTVTAVLGPTNTGKTHLAIERMLAHESGLIGLPLRLLAREVYGKLVARAGADAVALVTGEEKIVPEKARYWVSTVEAMPRETDVQFVAIDEVQLAGDLERGHVFTDRILNLRGRGETLLLGAATIRGLLEKLLPGLNVVTRPRMSLLTYSGSKKITRLPPRSAIVAFSADEVYGIAELIRRQRGGAAVVLGALSPRTRNAQVELFQSGDVDTLIATDAIGMGLNLDVDHIAFAGNRKFDGYQYRQLTAGELGQIAGRAGRHLRDGTFGVTGRVDDFDDELVQALESHQFAPLKTIQWRNSHLDFSSIRALRAALDEVPREEGLTRAPPADDYTALDFAARDDLITSLADKPDRVRLLWEVCALPDYRKIAPANHAELVTTVYDYLVRRGRIPDDWFARAVSEADKTEGDIDTISNRIAHIRTWTFIANRPDWVMDPTYWRETTRAVEDRLSDALHDRLTQRFVDRRTSVLMRRLRENAMLEAEITAEGDVLVEGHRVGHLDGFRFAPDQTAEGTDAKAVRNAAAKSLASEIETRAEKLSKAPNGEFALASDGTIRWLGQAIAKLSVGQNALTPAVIVLADDQLTGPAREKVDTRLALWVKAHVEGLLKPLIDLRDAPDLEGMARGVAFQLIEALGVLERQHIADEVKALDQPMRASLRKYGVRFGAYHIFLPLLLKPAPSGLIAQLWALKNGNVDAQVVNGLHQLSMSGRTSIPVDKTIPKALYKVVGYRVCGERAVRIDILERLADLVRPLIAWKPLDPSVQPPDGAVPGGGGFAVTVAMTSLVGCSGEDFASILKSLGYRLERRKVTRPVAAPAAEAAATGAETETTAQADAAPAPDAELSGDAAAPADTAETAAAAGEPAADEVAAIAERAETLATFAASESDGGPEALAAAEEVLVTEALNEITETAESEPVEAASDDAEASADAEVAADAEPAADADRTAPVEPAASEPATEQVEIEIWRPGRFERREPGARGRDQRGPQRAPREGGANRGEGRGPRPAGGEGEQKREGGERRGGGGERPEGRGDRPRDGGRERFNRDGGPRDGAPRDGGGHRDGGQRDGGQRDGGQRDGGHREGGHRDGGQREGWKGNQGSGSGPRRDDRPKRPEKPIDPNSPFAKLAALKAELEQKGKK
ncbi:helicase [Prosthecomicrobium hirschii]|uniref:helicase-related protein n=1 Tax=Prosthecodimorpha hirschii TaxID=665126 RepID=UPI00112A4C1D|nr:helicase-related protein [Prosthecomicrobium hirschii]TPQ52438.1 helicase [Prosthecomicrobium hirschii]